MARYIAFRPMIEKLWLLDFNEVIRGREVSMQPKIEADNLHILVVHIYVIQLRDVAWRNSRPTLKYLATQKD